VINRYVINRTSYNGGHGGIVMRPGEAQLAYAREHHVYATPAQRGRANDASRDRHNYATPNRYGVNSQGTTTHVNSHVAPEPAAKAAAKPAGKPGKGAKPNNKSGNKPPA